jgi:hypothetical protein
MQMRGPALISERSSRPVLVLYAIEYASPEETCGARTEQQTVLHYLSIKRLRG